MELIISSREELSGKKIIICGSVKRLGAFDQWSALRQVANLIPPQRAENRQNYAHSQKPKNTWPSKGWIKLKFESWWKQCEQDNGHLWTQQHAKATYLAETLSIDPPCDFNNAWQTITPWKHASQSSSNDKLSIAHQKAHSCPIGLWMESPDSHQPTKYLQVIREFDRPHDVKPMHPSFLYINGHPTSIKN